MSLNNIVDMITVWSDTAGLPTLKEPQFPSEDRQEISKKLIAEEFHEFLEAVTLEDVADSLGDTLWVTIRAMMEYGIDPERTIRAIFISNMSKFDNTEEQAQISVQQYKEKDIETYYEKVSGLYVIKRKSDNKVLKSHKFVKPNFSLIFANQKN